MVKLKYIWLGIYINSYFKFLVYGYKLINWLVLSALIQFCYSCWCLLLTELQ